MGWYDNAWDGAQSGWGGREWAPDWGRSGTGYGKAYGKGGKGGKDFGKGYESDEPLRRGMRQQHITVEAALEVIQRQMVERDTLDRLRHAMGGAAPPPQAQPLFPPSPPAPHMMWPTPAPDGPSMAAAAMQWGSTPAMQEPTGAYVKEAVSAMGSIGSAIGGAAVAAIGRAIRCALRGEDGRDQQASESAPMDLFSRVGMLLRPGGRSPRRWTRLRSSARSSRRRRPQSLRSNAGRPQARHSPHSRRATLPASTRPSRRHSRRT